MKVVKTGRWYDPEGLNIDNKIDIIFEGTTEECENKIHEMYDDLVIEYASRKDIYVNKFYDRKNGFPYIEVYFSLAISKKIYQIIE